MQNQSHFIFDFWSSIRVLLQSIRKPEESVLELVQRACDDPRIFSRICSLDPHGCINASMLHEYLHSAEFINSIQ